MIINNNLQAIRSVYAKAAVNNTRKAANTEESKLQDDDELVLSPAAQSFSSQLQALHGQDSDVRMDKVQYFQEKLASGTYDIDAEALAGKILDCRF